MADNLSVIGKNVRQKDGSFRVTGEARYYSDIWLPGTLTVRLLRSPHAQADIVSLDIREAEALAGIELVMTYQNFPQVFRRDLHYAGEHVAAVVAVDGETAEAALDLIRVEYEKKPFVLSLEEALQPDAPQVFAGQPNCHDWELSYYLSDKDPQSGLWRKKELHEFHGFGDVEQGFREADVIVAENGLKYAYCKSPAMNPRGCLMSYSNEKLTVYTHTPAMHHHKALLADVFGLSLNQINYVSPYTGSSFGGKSARPQDINHPSHYLGIAGFAALTLHKPVRCAYSREEEMLCGWSRGSLADVKLGFKQDGTLTTIDYTHWQEVGAGGDKWTAKNSLLATGTTLYSHNCEHMRGKIYYVHTNRYLSSGWQGYGSPEGHYAMETVMDMAAEKLGIDPIELRKKNHMHTGTLIVAGIRWSTRRVSYQAVAYPSVWTPVRSKWIGRVSGSPPGRRPAGFVGVWAWPYSAWVPGGPDQVIPPRPKLRFFQMDRPNWFLLWPTWVKGNIQCSVRSHRRFWGYLTKISDWSAMTRIQPHGQPTVPTAAVPGFRDGPPTRRLWRPAERFSCWQPKKWMPILWIWTSSTGLFFTRKCRIKKSVSKKPLDR